MSLEAVANRLGNRDLVQDVQKLQVIGGDASWLAPRR